MDRIASLVRLASSFLPANRGEDAQAGHQHSHALVPWWQDTYSPSDDGKCSSCGNDPCTCGSGGGGGSCTTYCSS